jgi:DNA-binding response OmpR family regulator
MARILLIDDDDLVRAMLSQTLAHFGHVVIEARDGKEGMTLFAASGADLVITDLVMPEKEGLEVVMELLAGGNPPRIIAMSGGGRRDPTNYLTLAKHLGAAAILSKPFSSEVLMAAVNGLLPA